MVLTIGERISLSKITFTLSILSLTRNVWAGGTSLVEAFKITFIHTNRLYYFEVSLSKGIYLIFNSRDYKFSSSFLDFLKKFEMV